MPTGSLPRANFNFLRSTLCIFLLACWVFLAEWSSTTVLAVASRGCSRRPGRAFPRAGSLGRAQASPGPLRTGAPWARGSGAWAPQRRPVAVARGLSSSPARGLFPAGTRVCCTGRQLPHRRGGPLRWAIQHCMVAAVSSPEQHPSAVPRQSFLQPVTGKLLVAWLCLRVTGVRVFELWHTGLGKTAL